MPIASLLFFHFFSSPVDQKTSLSVLETPAVALHYKVPKALMGGGLGHIRGTMHLGFLP